MKAAFRAVAFVSLFLAVALPASAQEPVEEKPGDHARFQWGALRFTPGIAVTDIGVDNNVFNDAEHPVSDTTMAVGPAVNAWLNVGALRVSEKSAGQYLYFRKNDNQRSWNTADELKLELPLSRFRPFAIGSYANTRQRPGFEIDSRARATTNMAMFGSDVRMAGRSLLTLSAARTTTAFDAKETFLGSDLALALNRHSDSEVLQFHYALTPLTTFVTTVEAVQDRFEHDRLRNADSISVRPGFEFKPFALISGKVSVGFRHFNVLNEAVRDYQGLVASVDAKYTLGAATLISARVNRDLMFSFDESLPYYALTESGVSITQRLASSWDVLARAGWQALAYRGVISSLDLPRTDRGQMYGLGLGYLIDETFRIGLDVNYYLRRSPLTQRNYDGLRAGVSVSYGLSQ